MIYLQISGRLGNQLFQYAYARYLQHLTGDKLVIDFRKVLSKNDNTFEEFLNRYNVAPYSKPNGIEIPKLTHCLIQLQKRLKPKKNIRLIYYYERLVSPILSLFGICMYESNCHIMNYHPKKGKFNYIEGYFESSRYFNKIEDIIRKEFTPKKGLSMLDQRLYNILKYSNSICVTIRRGDFITNLEIKDRFDVCSVDYFKKGVEYIQNQLNNTIIYVCSNDNEWCRKNMQFRGKTIFERDGLSISEKLSLMSACRNFVISNSTFSWWAQYLSDSPSKIVVAPKKWRNESPEPVDIKEDYWTYL